MDVSVFFVSVNQGVINSCRFLKNGPPADPNNADSDLPKLDPIYYYNTYPDVAKVVGKNAQGLLEHYFAYGYSEGRLPYYGADPCTEVQTSY